MTTFPSSIEGFEPERILGQGGFGSVWLARQTSLDRDVAIKVGLAPLTSDDSRQRFDRECKALGRLTSRSNIVDVFTSGFTADGLPYIVMEYVSGGTLKDRLGSMTESELRSTTIQLCDALQAAHDVGILHRDLKPENIFLRNNGEVVVGDFGIARLNELDITKSGGIPATVAYAAPETLSGAAPTPKTDVYGIGITMVTAVLGQNPFRVDGNDSVPSLLNRVLSSPMPDITGRVSQAYAAILQDAVAKEPEQRIATAQQFKHRVEALSPGATTNHLDPTAAFSTDSNAEAGQASGSPAIDHTAPTVSNEQFANLGNANKAASTGQQGPQIQHPQFQSGHPYPQPFQSGQFGQQPSQPATNTFGSTGQSGSSGVFPASPPPQGGGGKSGSGKIMAVGAIAAVAIFALGSIFLIRQLGDDSVSADSTIDPAGDTTAATSTAPASTTVAQTPIALPLNLQDIVASTGLSRDSSSLEVNDGPANNTLYCVARPSIEGLEETVAQIYAPLEGITGVAAQRVMRFDTPENAAAHMDSYVETASCGEWQEVITDGGSSTLSAQATEPTQTFGDQTVQVDVTTTLPNGLVTYGRGIMVRRGTDVVRINFNTLLQQQAETGADGMAALAAEAF